MSRNLIPLFLEMGITCLLVRHANDPVKRDYDEEKTISSARLLEPLEGPVGFVSGKSNVLGEAGEELNLRPPVGEGVNIRLTRPCSSLPFKALDPLGGG